jgi:hypothetical protein
MKIVGVLRPSSSDHVYVCRISGGQLNRHSVTTCLCVPCDVQGESIGQCTDPCIAVVSAAMFSGKRGCT